MMKNSDTSPLTRSGHTRTNNNNDDPTNTLQQGLPPLSTSSSLFIASSQNGSYNSPVTLLSSIQAEYTAQQQQLHNNRYANSTSTINRVRGSNELNFGRILTTMQEAIDIINGFEEDDGDLRSGGNDSSCRLRRNNNNSTRCRYAAAISDSNANSSSAESFEKQ